MGVHIGCTHFVSTPQNTMIKWKINHMLMLLVLVNLCLQKRDQLISALKKCN